MADVTKQIERINRLITEYKREIKRLRIERRQLTRYQSEYHRELEMNVKRVGG